MTQIIPVAIMNLVTPEAGAKHELLFNKPASCCYTHSADCHYIEFCYAEYHYTEGHYAEVGLLAICWFLVCWRHFEQHHYAKVSNTEYHDDTPPYNNLKTTDTGVGWCFAPVHTLDYISGPTSRQPSMAAMDLWFSLLVLRWRLNHLLRGSTTPSKWNSHKTFYSCNLHV